MKNSDEVVGLLREWTQTFMRRSIADVVFVARQRGFSMSQVGALFQLSHRTMSGVSGIGDSLGVTSAAASQMLDRLVHQGLIARREDPNNRRAKQITLTERGRGFIHKIMKARQRWFEYVAAGMSQKERETVVAGLRILIEKTSKADPDSRPCHQPIRKPENAGK